VIFRHLSHVWRSALSDGQHAARQIAGCRECETCRIIPTFSEASRLSEKTCGGFGFTFTFSQFKEKA